MNKRQKLKKKKREYVTFAYKIDIASEMKEDSIAHKIKSYFELDSIQNKMMFKWDNENKTLKVSRKSIIYLLSLCNDIEREKDYKMKIVDDIRILEEDK